MYPSQTKSSRSSAVGAALTSSGIAKHTYPARVLVNIGQYFGSDYHCNFNGLPTETLAKYWPILANTSRSVVVERVVVERAVVQRAVVQRAAVDGGLVDCVPKARDPG